MNPLSLMNPVTTVVPTMTGVATIGALGAFCFACRKKIPHPSEFSPIGKICLTCGCHKHKKFDLVITTHEATNLPRSARVYLYVEVGRTNSRTQEVLVDKEQRGQFHERLTVHVRQVDTHIKLMMFKSLTLSSEQIGEMRLNVMEDLFGADFPISKWYQFTNEGKYAAKLRMSFYKLEGVDSEASSPLLQQAIIQAQQTAMQKGVAPPVINFLSMPPKDRIVLLAGALEGPIKMMKGLGIKKWSSVYFKAHEVKKNDWEWAYYRNKEDCYKNQKKIGRFRLLAISTVLPDPANRHQFYVKYHDKQGAHDFMFLRVDRDRNVWSDGLYEFLERLRDYREKYPVAEVVHEYVVSRKAMIAVIDEKAKRIPSPAVKKEVSGQVPSSVSAMLQEMYDDSWDTPELPDFSERDDESVAGYK